MLVILRINKSDVYGGVEQKILSIATQAIQDDIELVVFVLSLNQRFIQKLKKHNINYIELQKISIVYVISQLRNINPTVLQAHQLIDSLYTRMYKFFYKKTIIVQRVHTHIDGYVRNGFKKKILQVIDRLTFSKVDHCLTISASLKKELSYLNKLHMDKVKVLENGVDLPEKRPREKLGIIPTACIIGDISERKNQVNTVRLLREQAFIKRVYICGEVKPEVELEFLREVNSEQSIEIIYLGYTDRAKLFDIYQKSSFSILLSKFEGVPTTLLEARFFGLIPIFTNVGAVSEYIVDGDNGFLIEPNSINSRFRDIFANLDVEHLKKMQNHSYACFHEDFREKSMYLSFKAIYMK